MTKQTTDPVEVLEANIIELQGTLDHVKGLESTARHEKDRAEKSFRLAAEHHQRRCDEVEAIEKGMIDHREAIARLKSLAKGSTIVYNYSPQAMDDDHECPTHGSLECPTGQHP